MNANRQFACSTVGGVNIANRKNSTAKMNLMVTRDLETWKYHQNINIGILPTLHIILYY